MLECFELKKNDLVAAYFKRQKENLVAACEPVACELDYLLSYSDVENAFKELNMDLLERKRNL